MRGWGALSPLETQAVGRLFWNILLRYADAPGEVSLLTLWSRPSPLKNSSLTSHSAGATRCHLCNQNNAPEMFIRGGVGGWWAAEGNTRIPP